MRRYFSLAALVCGAVLSTVAAGAEKDTITYPPTRRVEQSDQFHGVAVADPYRWLETDIRQSEEVAAWAKAENALATKYLEGLPGREEIKKRLEQLWNYERYSPPVKVGKRYAFSKNDGLQNQAVLYLIDSLDAQPRVLLDPNTWSTDGAVALAGISFSEDGRYLAYGVSESGSDWQTWHVMEVATRKVYDDAVRWVKFGEAAWGKEGSGFYYPRYEEPKSDEQFQQLNLNQRICFHRVGSPQSDDKVVYRRTDHPDWCFAPQVTDDGHYLVILVRKADDERFRIVVQDLTRADAKPVELVDNFDNQFFFAGSDGDEFYFVTDNGAPRRRLVAIDTRSPEPSKWREIIPQGDETLTEVGFVGDHFLAVSLKDANTHIRVFKHDGTPQKDVQLPSLGTAVGFQGRRTDSETFYSFSSYATPTRVYRYDVPTGKSALFREPKLPFNPGDYQVEQVFYKSKDGTRVPMFVSSKKGIKLDGSNPTLLYGYGGFGISIKPQFSASALAWMEMGGVYAVANLRGGGEYGEAWHAAGAKTNKQNVFDDFVAAAEWLIDKGYTRKDKLAIQGASNGGLLVAAVMLQRPDLFGACLSEVPVTDMLRFQHYTDGRFWVTDYGSADEAAEFRVLLAYSPYHNVKLGQRYPPTMVMTADTDDRVVPMHSFKFVAALQRAQAGPAPILLRIATRGGHGGGKSISRRIDEVTDQFLFLRQALGMR
jgi:prolyl oligopeptidase